MIQVQRELDGGIRQVEIHNRRIREIQGYDNEDYIYTPDEGAHPQVPTKIPVQPPTILAIVDREIGVNQSSNKPPSTALPVDSGILRSRSRARRGLLSHRPLESTYHHMTFLLPRQELSGPTGHEERALEEMIMKGAR